MVEEVIAPLVGRAICVAQAACSPSAGASARPPLLQICFAPALREAGLRRQLFANALALCRDQKLPIKVFSIFKPGALRRVVLGEDEGTLVHV